MPGLQPVSFLPAGTPQTNVRPLARRTSLGQKNAYGLGHVNRVLRSVRCLGGRS
jgi:hypothetical protein